MAGIGTLIGLLIAAAVLAVLAYFFYFRRQGQGQGQHQHQPGTQHGQAQQQPHQVATPSQPTTQLHHDKPASVTIPMSMPTPTPAPAPVTPTHEQQTAPAAEPTVQVPAIVQSYQQLQQAVASSGSPPSSPNQAYPPTQPPTSQPMVPTTQPTFNVPLELPILPPSPPPLSAATNSFNTSPPPLAPSPAQLPTDGPVLPTSTPPPALPVLNSPTAPTSSSLLAVPPPALMLTPPTLPSPIPSDPTGWPAPGLESFAQAWHARPYIAGARTCRQPFISHSHDELAVSVGDRVIVTLVFSDGWGLGYRVGPNDLPLTNVHEGVFPLCVLQPEVGDEALVALERDLIARQQKQMAEAEAQAQAAALAAATAPAPATYYVSLPRAVEGSGTLPKSSLSRTLDDSQPSVKVVGQGDNVAFDMPPEIAVQVERGASLARRR